MKTLLYVLVVIFLALILIRAEAAPTFESPIQPPPPCYCSHMTFEACVNSDGCWLGDVDDVNYCTWKPWDTLDSSMRYVPPSRVYLPIALR